MSPSLAWVVTEDEFLILDDEEYDSTQAMPESPRTSKVQLGNDNSVTIGSLGGAISDIQGMLSEGISKIRSSISSARKKKVANAESSEELVLDDGSLEKVRPIAGKGANSADLMEAELVVDGVEQFEWQIRGMDCPDCAMKATRAVKRLPGTTEVVVSATEGSVRVNLDLARGRVSRVSSVLDSLGHSPDVEWRLVQGKTAGEVSNRLGVDRKGLRNALLEIPGILNASLDDGRIELQQITTNSQKVSEMTEEGLNRFCLLYTSPSPRDVEESRMPSSA